MAKRKLQEINASSMADIAFLLLIFFLVTTTMDTDSGIVTQLPPMPENDQNDETVDVKERNIFVVLVNMNDQLLVEGELMDIRNLRKAAKEFIANPYDDVNLPAKEIENLPFFGDVMITKKHVISLQNDNGTSYGTYIAVQNELMAAYNELRQELAVRTFGINYKDLDEERRDAVDDYYKKKISEAEPKNIGGS